MTRGRIVADAIRATIHEILDHLHRSRASSHLRLSKPPAPHRPRQFAPRGSLRINGRVGRCGRSWAPLTLSQPHTKWSPHSSKELSPSAIPRSFVDSSLHKSSRSQHFLPTSPLLPPPPRSPTLSPSPLSSFPRGVLVSPVAGLASSRAIELRRLSFCTFFLLIRQRFLFPHQSPTRPTSVLVTSTPYHTQLK